MDRKPNIIVTGMLDTKFNEIRFLADQVAVYGGNPVVMDLSLGQSADWADITREEVLKKPQGLAKKKSRMPLARKLLVLLALQVQRKLWSCMMRARSMVLFHGQARWVLRQ